MSVDLEIYCKLILLHPKRRDLNINKYFDWTSFRCKENRWVIFRGDRLIKRWDSWFSMKFIKVKLYKIKIVEYVNSYWKFLFIILQKTCK